MNNNYQVNKPTAISIYQSLHNWWIAIFIMTKLLVIASSVRDNRNNPRVFNFALRLAAESGFDAQLLDPEAYPELGLLKKPFHFYPDSSKAPDYLREINQKLVNADAFLVVSAEYNASIPPALSNLLDHFAPDVYAYKPAGIVAYTIGTNQCTSVITQLQTWLLYLGCICVPEYLTISEVDRLLTHQGLAIETKAKPRYSKAVADVRRILAQIQFISEPMRERRAHTSNLPEVHGY
ncbi:hypothetical protein Ciccas_008009 [Cichlidogyrus casuarinus]|uniref:NADPH-dependent FMN reductase-like domain-containing protein n=1 Tax=Cichlidogyrus casuarinus TaxID=1844966 RepID=A0ABD2Q2M2_9PLAT